MTDGHHDCPERKRDRKEMERQRTNLIAQVKENIKTPSNIWPSPIWNEMGRKESVQEMGIMLWDNTGNVV